MSTSIKFRGKLSKQGGRLIIIVPKALREMTSSIKGMELLIELKEIDKMGVRKKKKLRAR